MRLATPLALFIGLLCSSFGSASGQQTPTPKDSSDQPKPHLRPNDAGAAIPTRFDMLRGAYGPFRANNDLLYYHLDIRVDPEQHSIQGKNTVRFRMLRDGTRIQLDLNENLNIDKILLGEIPLKYQQDLERSKPQFAQAKGMIEAYQHYFGPYPFPKDGYKLIEAPYSGMEHQSAVTYGNLFKNVLRSL